jgi:hypothetical protein
MGKSRTKKDVLHFVRGCLSEGSQALLVSPSDKGTVEVKTLEWSEVVT